jgi:hypothetical protein
MTEVVGDVETVLLRGNVLVLPFVVGMTALARALTSAPQMPMQHAGARP